jgi:hypothetical protein
MPFFEDVFNRCKSEDYISAVCLSMVFRSCTVIGKLSLKDPNETFELHQGQFVEVIDIDLFSTMVDQGE